MRKMNRLNGLCAGLLWVGLALGCGGENEGGVVRVDAEFDPTDIADAFAPIHEANISVAQSFTVLADGKLERFSVVLTDGASVDSGTIRVTVRPVDASGDPDPDLASSIIDPFLVETDTLPASLVEIFTDFPIGDEPGRDVRVGEQYAVVVDFVSRNTNTDVFPIAIMLGLTDGMGDPYAEGSGFDGETGVAFTANTDDYFFRTFVLQ